MTVCVVIYHHAEDSAPLGVYAYRKDAVARAQREVDEGTAEFGEQWERESKDVWVLANEEYTEANVHITIHEEPVQ